MFFPIVKHINESIPDFARRPQGSRMKSVAPDATAPSEDAVHTLRDAYGESLQPAGEHADVQCLDEEMDVIVLDRELQNSETVARRLCQPSADGREDRVHAKRR